MATSPLLFLLPLKQGLLGKALQHGPCSHPVPQKTCLDTLASIAALTPTPISLACVSL